MCLLVVAHDASLFGGVLSGLGMEERAARIAGSRLRIMAALVGAGLLLIGLSIWARSIRLRSVSQAHAGVLQHLTENHVGRVDVHAGVGAVFSGEVAGLRLEVAVEPVRGGRILIRALSPAPTSLLIWPRGLAPTTQTSSFVRIAQGASWEAWAPSAGTLQGELMGPIEAVFLRAGATEMRHDRSGIEVTLPNAPGIDLVQRIELGVQAASALSRANR